MSIGGALGDGLHERIEELLEKIDTQTLTAEQLRTVRAVEALEWMDSEESREVLRGLAGGAEGARVTVEAKGAVERSVKK